MTGCAHNQGYCAKDLLLVVGLILIFFVLREGIAWLLKTNHTYSAVKQNEHKLDQVLRILQKNGLKE